MEFSDAELTAIEAACRARADFYTDLAHKVDRPIQRNQRLDTAKELLAIANRIQEDRQQRAIHIKSDASG